MTKITEKIPTVLSIAGSDPSGGAGIQADLKTFMAAGVYGAAVITALTAQNTRGVDGAMAVPAEFVDRQMASVLADIPIHAVKLGMLPNREICEIIAGRVKALTVVCDPVMVSTSGHQLIDDAAVKSLMTEMIPASDFITPNLAELEILCRGPVTNMEAAGRELLNQYPDLCGAVLKGGHSRQAKEGGGTVTDWFIFRENKAVRAVTATHPHIHTRNTHGTGCTFSSAFAAFLARGKGLEEAFFSAVDLTANLISISADHAIGGGHGPLLHHKMASTGRNNHWS
ncbi:MAG: bifunctional hydroxymethylpyrimidine kinase/phosphomethylpyrimidine kinase [Desulfobacteraceae bacterium]|nr:bifunctional hydroxymethylpyrimidine kinase/phosphomethylpyrimidine kinase [Desulfobacteraceae bacterium]